MSSWKFVSSFMQPSGRIPPFSCSWQIIWVKIWPSGQKDVKNFSIQRWCKWRLMTMLYVELYSILWKYFGNFFSLQFLQIKTRLGSLPFDRDNSGREHLMTRGACGSYGMRLKCVTAFGGNRRNLWVSGDAHKFCVLSARVIAKKSRHGLPQVSLQNLITP